MGLITTASFAKNVWPGVKKWMGMNLSDHDAQYVRIFTKETSDKLYEEYVSTSMTGLTPVMAEGEAVSYDSIRQGYVTRLTNVNYGLGIKVTSNAIADGLGFKVATTGAKALVRSDKLTRETVGANVLNRAFSDSYTGGDGKELCATDHPNTAGGTYQNELTTASDLNEYAIEQSIIGINTWEDDRGLPIAIKAKLLVVHPNDMFEAERLLKSAGRVDSADNDINAIKSMGVIPGGFTANNYLTDPDAWFIVTDCPDGLIYQERQAAVPSKDKEFDTDNFCFKIVARYVFGWGDPKGVWGSPGV